MLRIAGRVRRIALVKLWKWEPENLPSVIHSVRTAIAATISFAVARLFGLPEAYWAAIATLMVTLRERHTPNHPADSAFKRRLGRCHPPLPRSLGWNRRRPGAGGCVARAPTRVGETERRVNCAVVAGVSPAIPGFAANTAASAEFRMFGPVLAKIR